jgi:ketosteroid isomerase-like protein
VSHPNEDLIRRFYDARARDDLDAVRSILAPDVRWHDPYPEPHGGDLVGAEAVIRQVFAAAGETEARFGLHDVLANDEHAVALVEWSATVAGETLDGREVGVYHVRDGRITEVWFLPEDVQGYTEFFSAHSRRQERNGLPGTLAP